jgi:hypothetical protein
MSARRTENLQVRVTPADATSLDAVMLGVKPTPTLRAMVEDAIAYKAEADRLCAAWTAAQERGDGEAARWYAAVIAQEYRLRTTEFVDRLRELGSLH